MSEKPDLERGISVLIPTYNPEIEDMRQILGALANQEYRHFEVIIANDGRDFSSDIADIVPFGEVPFQFRNNPWQMGLYGSIKENLKYCRYENILVLEQDIVPLSPKYLEHLAELMEASPLTVVTSKLVIDAKTDYKKFVFYKRRIANLDVFDAAAGNDSDPNCAVKTEIAFTKADLLSKKVLSELFSKGSTNKFTAQDIILTSIAQKSGNLVTSNATACEVGLRDPNNLSFFLKKEFLYGNSVLDAWRFSNKSWLTSTSYFKEKLFRVLFMLFEAVALLAVLLDFFVGGALIGPILASMLGVGLLYTQAVLLRIGFWRFWRRSKKLAAALVSGAYVALLDLAYALGILRRLLL